LLAARIDRDLWFSLRYETWRRGMALAGSDLYGLVGPRVSPIPHQLSIAAEVAGRPSPGRVGISPGRQARAAG
jgi:ATP-dependent helicase HepA